MKPLILYFLSFIQLLVLSCSPLKMHTTKSATETSVIDKQVVKLMEDTGIPSVSLAITKGNSIVYEKAYGRSNNLLRTPSNTETLYAVGSCVKTIMAISILQLYEKGLIDLDISVNNYLKLPNPSFEKFDKPITIRHLLTHQSGINSSANFFPLWEMNQARSLREIVRDIAPSIAPETNYLYANEGFVVLAVILEDLTGQTCEAYLQEHILDKLAIHNIGVFQPKPERIQKMALPYKLVYNKAHPVYQEYSEPYPGGGMSYFSPSEYARVLIALAQDGRYLNKHILKPSTVDLLKKTYFGHEYYGLGIAVERNADDEITLFHNGLQNGYTAAFRLNYDQKLSVTVMANATVEQPVSALADWILKHYCNQELPGDLPSFRSQEFQPRYLSSQEKSKYLGSYTIYGTDLQIQIVMKDNELFLINPAGIWYHIISYDQHKFFLEEEEAQVHFELQSGSQQAFSYISTTNNFKAIRDE